MAIHRIFLKCFGSNEKIVFNNDFCLTFYSNWLEMIMMALLLQKIHTIILIAWLIDCEENSNLVLFYISKFYYNTFQLKVIFWIDQHAELDFYSASSLKQQSAGRHVAPFWHIILIPSQPDFALSPLCRVLSGEATNTNFIVWFDPIRALIHDIPHSRRAH